MTKFVAFYNLCSIHDPKEFLGIAEDRTEGNIIATLDKNMAVVLKMSTQKQLRCWPMLEKLSTKVVYNQRSEKYCGVFAQRTLRCWDEDTNDVSKCKKVKFSRNIADLIQYKGDILVLFADGTLESLERAIESRKVVNENDATQQLQAQLQAPLTDATSWSLSDGRCILTYFQRQSNGLLDLVRLPLGADVTQRFTLQRTDADVQLVGHAVIEGENAPILLTIWSDRQLYLFPLDETAKEEQFPGNLVGAISDLSVQKPIIIKSLSSHYIVLYGASKAGDGSYMLLYNTQFKVVKAKQFFKVFFDFSRLWAIEGYIMLSMAKKLSVVAYHISTQLLAELVGSQICKDNAQPIVQNYINEQETLTTALQFVDVANANTENSQVFEAPKQIIAKTAAADGKKVPFEAFDNFEQELDTLNKLHMRIDVKQTTSILADEVQLLLKAKCHDNGVLSNTFKVFINELETCGASEYEITEKALTVAIRADLLEDISGCLQRYSNVSEKILAQTLKYLLSKLNAFADAEDKPELSNGKDENEPKEEPEKAKLVTAINALISCSFDVSALVPHVRNEIDFPLALCLLEHLYTLLTTCQQTLETSVTSNLDFELQVLRWFGVCLNTHFQKLALSTDERLMILLENWQLIFNQYRKQLVQLENLTSLLTGLLNSKKVLKEKSSSKWYSIEEIVLY